MTEMQGKRFKRSGGAAGSERAAHRASAPVQAAHAQANQAHRAGAHMGGAAYADGQGQQAHAAGAHHAAGVRPVTPVSSASHASSVHQAAAPAAYRPSGYGTETDDVRRGAKSSRRVRSIHDTDLKESGRHGGSRGGHAGGNNGRRGGNDNGSTNGGGKKRNVLSTLLIVVGVVCLLAALGIFINAQIGYKQATDTYDGLAQYAKVSDKKGDDIPDVNFDELEKINKDVVGWIYIPGTSINYPVVQGTDNKHYLRTLFDGTHNVSGSIFMDCDGTKPGMVDQQTTIYGHHMENGGMFNPIADTADQAKFDNIKTVYYITRDNVYKCKPLLTHVVDGSFNDARTPNFTKDGKSLQSYLSGMLKDAEAKASDADGRVTSADRVLTLITCKRDILANGRAAMISTIEEQTPRQ